MYIQKIRKQVLITFKVLTLCKPIDIIVLIHAHKYTYTPTCNNLDMTTLNRHKVGLKSLS